MNEKPESDWNQEIHIIAVAFDLPGFCSAHSKMDAAGRYPYEELVSGRQKIRISPNWPAYNLTRFKGDSNERCAPAYRPVRRLRISDGWPKTVAHTTDPYGCGSSIEGGRLCT